MMGNIVTVAMVARRLLLEEPAVVRVSFFFIFILFLIFNFFF